MTPQKILVTGGAGFIGSNLVRLLLSQGHAVRILDDLSRGADENIRDFESKIDVVRGSILDESVVKDACEGQEAVVHLAAVQGTQNFYKHPYRVLNVNVKGILNVLDACGSQNIKRFLFSSSSEVYGFPTVFPTPESEPMVIPDVLNPRYSYSSSKMIGEMLALHFSKQYGFDYTIVRYHNVYGPGMGWDHVIPQFISRLVKQEPFTIQGDGNQSRAFCYISDAVEATAMALVHPKGQNQIFNIGNQKEEHKIRDVIRMLEKVSKIKIQPQSIPFEGEGTKRRCPDMSRIQTALGFKPKVTLEEGLKKTYDWYKEAIQKEHAT